MSITLDFSTQGEILVARLEGAFDERSDELADREIAKQCIEQSLRKALIDFRNVDGMPATYEIYQSGVSLGERGFTRDIKLAFVDRIEFKEANEFYALVAANHGFSLRHFYSEEAAIEWLLE